ncbi:nuclease (SNase domain protein) [Thermococcus sp. 4557]|uniref:lamin tail domain-containing protein n=1 Tax=Thermococcus sp. (strain CGMCC 1.5172 / 4557) TaxID=1042877 RepID=UPI000219EBCC|nr:lamin tail domain-containing protein [Thermococcus sp. 4557]AEK72220.1 nuclease (SNase domain protein) [Thermococcus sp. 4557]
MTRRTVPLLLILVIVLSATIATGCIGGSTPTTTFTESYPTDTFSEASSIDNSHPTSSGKNIPTDAIKVYVIKVIDGDTIDIAFPNGTTDRVRFLGVDTPETSASRNKPNEYDHITDLKCLASWGVEAKFFTRDYLLNRVIYIQFDPDAGKRGYYGRLLAYIYLENGTDFTALLVKKGYARVYTEGKFQKEHEYLSYQRTAESKKLGLWGCEIGQYADTSTVTHVATTGEIAIVKIHYDAGGPNVRDTEVLNDEYVVLKNKGSKAVDLKGWVIMDEANHKYYFPSVILQPGQEIVLHTGRGSNTSHDLYWGSKRAIWNNDHDTAYLYDAQGRLVDKFSW